MSRRALHLGIRDIIRSRLNYKPSECDVTFDGQPKPACGQLFIAVHRGPRSSLSQTGQEFAYECQITLSARVKESYDRLGTDLMEKALTGLDDRADAIIDLIHMDGSTKLLAAINRYIDESKANAFTEPPSFEGDDGGRLVGGDWFHADPQAQECGVAMTLRFGKAKRLRRIEDLGLNPDL